MSSITASPAVSPFLDETITRRIRYRTGRLRRKFGLSKEDRRDLEQDFRLALLQALGNYCPGRCPVHSYTLAVINRRYKHHVRQRANQCHRRSRTPHAVAFEDLERDFEYRLVDPRAGSHAEQVDRRLDLEQALTRMPAAQRRVCELLMSGHSPSQAARRLGVARSSITRAMQRIRQHLNDQGLGRPF